MWAPPPAKLWETKWLSYSGDYASNRKFRAIYCRLCRIPKAPIHIQSIALRLSISNLRQCTKGLYTKHCTWPNTVTGQTLHTAHNGRQGDTCKQEPLTTTSTTTSAWAAASLTRVDGALCMFPLLDWRYISHAMYCTRIVLYGATILVLYIL